MFRPVSSCLCFSFLRSRYEVQRRLSSSDNISNQSFGAVQSQSDARRWTTFLSYCFLYLRTGKKVQFWWTSLFLCRCLGGSRLQSVRSAVSLGESGSSVSSGEDWTIHSTDPTAEEFRKPTNPQCCCRSCSHTFNHHPSLLFKSFYHFTVVSQKMMIKWWYLWFYKTLSNNQRGDHSASHWHLKMKLIGRYICRSSA